MIPVLFSKAAMADLERLRLFIEEHDARAASEAGRAVAKTIRHIQRWPLFGYPVRGYSDIRDAVISFGKRGYVLRYRITAKRLEILRVWHQRENQP